MLGEFVKTAVLELNASDERGIDVVRDKVKAFAHQKIVVPDGMHKIIILDEADSMTEAAQQALRMVMTEYTDTTRFALACNDSSKIIEPIQSRCAIVRFTNLTDEEVLKRLTYVIDEEKVEYDDDGLQALLFTAQGDMRYALNNLQATVAGFGKVTTDAVYKVCDQPHPELMKDVINFCIDGQFQDATNEINTVYEEGYNILDIIGTLARIIQIIDMNDERRIKFLKAATEFKMRILDGNDSLLQLHAFLATLCVSS